MTTDTLRACYSRHAGKVSDKWQLYLDVYQAVLAEYRDKPVSVLEIGIQNGGSLEIWSRYFRNAIKLVGCDINTDCARLRYDDPRIAVVVADANTDDAERRIAAEAEVFDIIIDDGSHRSGDIVRSFARYFHRVREGGVYVVEDLHCSYWAQFEGGLFNPHSSMSFFKRLVDVINFEHWGLERPAESVLAPIFEVHGGRLKEGTLSSIHSIQFFNSVCVIQKRAAELNRLGPRVVAGTEEEIVPGSRTLHGTACGRSDQSRFQGHADPATVEADLRREIAQRDGRIAGLRRAVAERDSEIAILRRNLEAEE